MDTHELSARTQSIYSQLSDDISMRVFCLRLSHYLLGKCFLHSQYAEEFLLQHPEVNSKISNIINSWFLEYVNVKEICIYGAGSDGQNTYYLINRFLGKNNERQFFFCDSNEQKQGTKISGVDILAPNQLRNMPNSLIIISINNITAQNDVIRNLIDAGIDKKRIRVSFISQIWHEVIYTISKAQYFDNDVFSCSTDFGSKQIFIDAGSLDFMTSLDYAKFSAAQQLKIIAFEPNPTQYSICKHNAKNLLSNGGG